MERKPLYISWKIKPREKFSRDKKANPNATFWLDWIIKKHLVSSHDDELTSFLQHFRSEIFSARWKMFSQAYCIIFNELKWILLSDGSKQTVWGTRELSELLMNSKCFQFEEGKKFSVPLKLRPIHNCVLNKFAFAAKGRRKHFQNFSDASGKKINWNRCINFTRLVFLWLSKRNLKTVACNSASIYGLLVESQPRTWAFFLLQFSVIFFSLRSQSTRRSRIFAMFRWTLWKIHRDEKCRRGIPMILWRIWVMLAMLATFSLKGRNFYCHQHFFRLINKCQRSLRLLK